MSMHTVGWVLEQSFGDPLMRSIMLALAMDTGSDREMPTTIARIAKTTTGKR